MKRFLFGVAPVLLALAATGIRAEPDILPFRKGSFAEIKAQRRDRPFVLIFWSETCSYCMKELAMFGKLQPRFPKVELVTVATDSYLEDETVRNVLERSGLELVHTWAFDEAFPEMIYTEVDKRWRGELPVTHFFSRDNREVRHMGAIGEQDLVDWMNEQSEE